MVCNRQAQLEDGRASDGAQVLTAPCAPYGSSLTVLPGSASVMAVNQTW
jgi:hypothetical protein